MVQIYGIRGGLLEDKVMIGEDGRRPNSGDETAGLESGSAGIDLGGLWFAASNTIYLLTVLMLFGILMLYSGSFQIIVLRTALSPIEKQSHSLSISSPLEP